MKITEIPFVNWLEEPIKQSFKNVFDGINENAEAMDIFKKYRNNHFSYLNSELNSMQIMGMGKPIELKNIYSTTFVSEIIKGRHYAKEYTNHDGNIIVETRKPTLYETGSGENYVEKNDRIVILGGPGSGKTTFLKHLALSFVDKTMFEKTELKTSKFPIFVQLPSLDKPSHRRTSLFNFISGRLVSLTDVYATNFYKKILKNGNAILLLDSLDEVQKSERPRINDEIIKFSNTYPNTKMVLTCRTADYNILFPNFTEVEIQKLTLPAIHTFIRVWFESDPKKAQRLIDRLRTHHDILNIIETPLLLSLVCIQFHHDLEIPRMKTELYRTCFDALLKEWDAQRNFRRDTAYSSLNDERKLKLFGYIAGIYFSDQIQYKFKTTDLIKEIGIFTEKYSLKKSHAKKVLKEIEIHHGIFEKYSQNYHQFSHPSFHEYFKARNLLDERNEYPTIRKYLHNDKWHSVIEFTTAMSTNPTKIFDLIEQNSHIGRKQYNPAIAKRINLLRLLYRCFMCGAALNPQKVKIILEYIIKSQIELHKLLSVKGIYPLPVIMSDSIKVVYYYTIRYQASIYHITRELSRLLNDILLMPSKRFTKYTKLAIKSLKAPKTILDDTFSAYLSLIMPLASSDKRYILRYLNEFKTFSEFGYLNDSLLNSIEIMEKYY